MLIVHSADRVELTPNTAKVFPRTLPDCGPTFRTHSMAADVPTRIAQTFADLRSARKMAFMPFVTAGDPDMPTTGALIRELASRGVDLIEVGFPYSDPIADGPVIQSSYTRALQKKLTVPQIFHEIASLDTANLPPLVAMVSYAIIFRIGTERFIKQAQDAGFAGFIIPDLPGDEAAEMHALVTGAGLDLIQLVAPTTPRERVQQIVQHCSGFVYCIAVAGTTGARDTLAAPLVEQLTWLKQETQLPLAVGFGLSKPEQLAPIQGLADGAIVGSAIVRHLEACTQPGAKLADVMQRVGEYAATMVTAAHRA